ncbi:MAG: phospholipase D-like domain-containing protein [Actinomycetota bacterium]
MGIARDFADAEAQLRQRPEIDLFSPIEESQLIVQPEFLELEQRVGERDAAETTRLCLQALRVQYENLESRLIDAEFVATLPPDSPAVARPTDRVLAEMLDNARREVILVGYEFTDQKFISMLAAAMQRGCEILIIADRGRGSSARIVGSWPSALPRPRIFQDREREGAAPYASMHAKCVVVDQQDLLVTSANFTFHGMRGNIEFGIRLSGKPAIEARKIFSHLVESRIVEELESAT